MVWLWCDVQNLGSLEEAISKKIELSRNHLRDNGVLKLWIWAFVETIAIKSFCCCMSKTMVTACQPKKIYNNLSLLLKHKTKKINLSTFCTINDWRSFCLSHISKVLKICYNEVTYASCMIKKGQNLMSSSLKHDPDSRVIRAFIKQSYQGGSFELDSRISQIWQVSVGAKLYYALRPTANLRWRVLRTLAPSKLFCKDRIMKTCFGSYKR